MSRKNTIMISILVLAAFAMTGCGTMLARASSGEQSASSAYQLAEGSQQVRTLSVNGTGMILLAPDLAYVTLGVRTQDLDAKAAVDQNNAQTEALIDALLALGVEEQDLRTTNFNIYSFEDYSEPFSEAPPMMYSVENSVFVTVRDLDSLGDLLSTAVEAGANNIWGIQFDVEDKTEAQSQAREAAVKAARAQAEELAGFAGVELGQIVNLSSYGGYPQPLGMGIGGGGGVMMETAAMSVPVSPGQLSISVDVNIVFEIQ